jgi:hypothetical protein
VRSADIWHHIFIYQILINKNAIGIVIYQNLINKNTDTYSNSICLSINSSIPSTIDVTTYIGISTTIPHISGRWSAVGILYYRGSRETSI